MHLFRAGHFRRKKTQHENVLANWQYLFFMVILLFFFYFYAGCWKSKRETGIPQICRAWCKPCWTIVRRIWVSRNRHFWSKVARYRKFFWTFVQKRDLPKSPSLPSTWEQRSPKLWVFNTIFSVLDFYEKIGPILDQLGSKFGTTWRVLSVFSFELVDRNLDQSSTKIDSKQIQTQSKIISI